MTEPLRGTYKGTPVVQINGGLNPTLSCKHCALRTRNSGCGRPQVEVDDLEVNIAICPDDLMWIPETQYPVFLLLGIESVKKGKP